MKTKLLQLLLFIALTSCSSVKQGHQALNEGNYSEAIAIAVEKLQRDKDKKANQEHILILEDAFRKFSETGQNRISFLKKEANPVNSREIYQLYKNLDRVQKEIYPLLPLHLKKSKREAKFDFTDLSDPLLEAKNAYAEYLYEDSRSLMNQNEKLSFRNAFKVLSELQKLSPNFRDTEELLDEAHWLGTDFVLVELKNQTPYVIPKRLEEELLNFNTYGLDDFWTEFHAVKGPEYKYDFAVNLNFREILISPERIQEREIPLEAEVLDGYTWKKDRKGEVVLDSLGNKIKIEKFIKVKGTLLKTIQSKSLALQGEVDYLDLERSRLLKSFPLATEFVFENVFASYEGDQRLLTSEDKQLLKNRFVPFPSNEQMLMDASEDIKSRLGPILKRNKLR